MKNLISILFFLNIGIGCISAQHTGSYDSTITFLNESRVLSFYVPQNYSPDSSYRLMVCLHGQGDNGTAYRNALINSLNWDDNFPNTIIVCPDGGSDASSDFYTPAGDQDILDSSIAIAQSVYSVDEENIILQGFSLGGRVALYHALSNTGIFKALLLNTPAIQGVKDALRPSSEGGYDYSAVGSLPVYITHGGSDITYEAPIDSTVELLMLQDASLRFKRISGVGHTIPPFAQMSDVLTFFDTPSFNGADLDVARFHVPLRSCETSSQNLNVLVRNTGTEEISGATFEYTVNNGAPQTFNWSGALLPFQHATVNLPAVSWGPAGNQDVEVSVSTLNGTAADVTPGNNSQTSSVQFSASGVVLPFVEGFEGSVFPPAGWLQEFAGDFYSPWDSDGEVFQSGTASIFAFNNILIFDNSGRSENLITPALDLSGAADPILTFDLSFNYLRYTPPYFTQDVDFTDTLEVAVSTDCGATWETLYSKFGAELSTFSQPIINPLSIVEGFTNPGASNWRKDTINLLAYVGNSETLIRFGYISGLGGSLNIDNVEVISDQTGLYDPEDELITIYPNPAAVSVQLNAGNERIASVDISDLSGKLIQHFSLSNSITAQLDVSGLNDGIYLLRVNTEKGITTKKLIVAR